MRQFRSRNQAAFLLERLPGRDTSLCCGRSFQPQFIRPPLPSQNQDTLSSLSTTVGATLVVVQFQFPSRDRDAFQFKFAFQKKFKNPYTFRSRNQDAFQFKAILDDMDMIAGFKFQSRNQGSFRVELSLLAMKTWRRVLATLKRVRD